MFFKLASYGWDRQRFIFFFCDISSTSPHPNDPSIFISCPLLKLIHPWCLEVPINLYTSTRMLLLSCLITLFVVSSWHVYLLLVHASKDLVMLTFHVQILSLRPCHSRHQVKQRFSIKAVWHDHLSSVLKTSVSRFHLWLTEPLSRVIKYGHLCVFLFFFKSLWKSV